MLVNITYCIKLLATKIELLFFVTPKKSPLGCYYTKLGIYGQFGIYEL